MKVRKISSFLLSFFMPSMPLCSIGGERGRGWRSKAPRRGSELLAQGNALWGRIRWITSAL